MSRARRLFALLDLIRGREELTVAEIAEALDVSARSVFRDLATLREQGYPISGEGGPGGGIRLERERGVAAVHLSDDELVALWLSAHLSRVATGLPWGKAARSGLDEVFASVPRARARQLRALCRRVVVGNPASENVRQGAAAPPPELLGLFERAFTGGMCLGFEYRDRNGRESRRRIEPHGLLVEPPVWYILAHDLDRGGGAHLPDGPHPESHDAARSRVPSELRCHTSAAHPPGRPAALTEARFEGPLRGP